MNYLTAAGGRESSGFATVSKKEYRDGISEDELKEYMKEHVETGKILKWWIPEKFLFVDEIPKTSTGKFNKKVLRPVYWDVLEK